MSKTIYVLSHDTWSSIGNGCRYETLPVTSHFTKLFESKYEAMEMLHDEADDVEVVDTMGEDDSVETKRIINIDDRVVMLIHFKSINKVIVEEWTIREKELI